MKAEAAEVSLFDRIKGFFRGVKTEFSKIIFPSQDDLKKQTTAVIVVSIFIGLLIFVIDAVFKFALGFIL